VPRCFTHRRTEVTGLWHQVTRPHALARSGNADHLLKAERSVAVVGNELAKLFEKWVGRAAAAQLSAHAAARSGACLLQRNAVAGLPSPPLVLERSRRSPSAVRVPPLRPLPSPRPPPPLHALHARQPLLWAASTALGSS
jgi:hypothetical protein